MAADAALAYGFGVLGLEEIWAEVVEANTRSMRIVRALGFSPTGRGSEEEFMGIPSVYQRFTLSAADWTAGKRATEPTGEKPRASSVEAQTNTGEDPPADPLALENQLCFALSLASRSVVAAYRPVLETLGLTHPQYLVMLALWEHEPLSIKALSNLLHLDPGALSPLVKRIEAIGYVLRSRSTRDERTLEIVLTEAGRAARDLAAEVPTEMMRRLDMDVEELGALRTSLDKVIDAAMKAPH